LNATPPYGAPLRGALQTLRGTRAALAGRAGARRSRGRSVVPWWCLGGI